MEENIINKSDAFLDELELEDYQIVKDYSKDPIRGESLFFFIKLLLRRFFAWIIDRFFIFIFFIISLSIIFGPYEFPYLLGSAIASLDFSWEFALYYKNNDLYNIFGNFINCLKFLSIYLIVSRIYYITFESLFSRTVGKMLLSLKYVKGENSVPKKEDFLYKNLIYIGLYVSMLSFLTFVIEALALIYIVLIINAIMIGVIFIKKRTLYELIVFLTVVPSKWVKIKR